MDRSKSTNYDQIRRETLISKGLCVNCAKFEPELGLKLCTNCGEKQTWNSLRSVYGLSKSDYFTLAKNQNFKCALCLASCGLPRTGATQNKTFKVDHIHGTETVRGLLCNNCNCTLGYYSDDYFSIINILDRTEEYLTRSIGIKPSRKRSAPFTKRNSQLGCLVHPNLSMFLNRKSCKGCRELVSWNEFKREYGFSKEEIFAHYNNRNFKCDLCNTKCNPGLSGYPQVTVFRVDHDHKTSVIRGLLCHFCNVMLGGYDDNLNLIKNVRNNLENYLK